MSGNAPFSVKSANKSRFPPGALFALIGVNQLNPLMTLCRSPARSVLRRSHLYLSPHLGGERGRGRERERGMGLHGKLPKRSCATLLPISRNLSDDSRGFLLEYAEDMERQRDFAVNQQDGWNATC